MAEHPQKPRPHGDPLRETVEPNQAQQQSDALADAGQQDGPGVEHTRGGRQGSTANGIPAADEDEGETRRRQYSEGAKIISRVD